MRGFLIDTSVISMLAPGRSERSLAFEDWVLRHAGLLHLSVMSVVEIEQGIAKLRRLGSDRRADDLAAWLALMTNRFGRKIVAIDVALAKAIGQLSDAAFATGRHPGLADIVIAATAQVGGLTVLTRNTKHFQSLGVSLLDPSGITE